MSYKRIEIHHPPIDEFVIMGIAISPQSDIRNVTVFIDLNLNGVFDPGEPYNYTYEEYYFDFYGLPEGSYSIRMINPDGCYQVYPGYLGYDRYYIGDGYVDYVTYFSDGGNKNYHGIYGGIVDSEQDINPSLDFILGDNSSTYLSFYDNYSIILSITNEVIVDMPGNDIYIQDLGNATVDAHVSVSNDGLEYTFLGILNNTVRSFDLDSINYDIPVRFIRLHFFGHQEEIVSRNITGIYGKDNTYYSIPFSYYYDSDSYEPLFVYDCSHYFECDTYCNYNVK